MELGIKLGLACRVAAVVSACGLAASALSLGGCEKKEDASVVAAGGSGASASTAEGNRSSRPAGKIDDSLLEQFPSLARVEQALDGAPVNISIVRAEELQKARDWLAENRPDLSPREAELMAQMLVMINDLLDATDVSLAKMKGMGESQLLQLWAMDADGDGRLSDEEARGSMERMMAMGEVMNDYNAARFDTDGDGVVSDEERGSMEELMMNNMEPMFKTMIDRATLVSWDSNGDGVLSDSEKAAGEAGLDFPDFDGDGERNSMEEMMAYQSILQDLGNGLVLLEQPDMSGMQAEMQAEMMASMQEMNAPAPNMADYDLDGDGVFSEIETTAFEGEMAAYTARQEAIGREMQQAGENMVAQMMQMQFDIAVSKLDGDRDGLLMNEEWEAGYEGLRGERDQRMFNYLYDADRSGNISDAEVARFMDSYDRKSIYADADLNGVVDTADLQYFVGQVSGG